MTLAAPGRYRHTSSHKQTKNHWARDDPAFVVVGCALVAAAAAAYCLAFSHSLGRSLLTILSAVALDYLAAGCLVATAGWALANRFLRRTNQHSHAVEQSVEWCVRACVGVWGAGGWEVAWGMRWRQRCCLPAGPASAREPCLLGDGASPCPHWLGMCCRCCFAAVRRRCPTTHAAGCMPLTCTATPSSPCT